MTYNVFGGTLSLTQSINQITKSLTVYMALAAPCCHFEHAVTLSIFNPASSSHHQ